MTATPAKAGLPEADPDTGPCTNDYKGSAPVGSPMKCRGNGTGSQGESVEVLRETGAGPLCRGGW